MKRFWNRFVRIKGGNQGAGRVELRLLEGAVPEEIDDWNRLVGGLRAPSRYCDQVALLRAKRLYRPVSQISMLLPLSPS